MEKTLLRLENKLDKVVDDIGEVKVIMAKNTVSLQEHIKRTNILEKQVAPMWTTYKALAVLISFTFVAAAILEILAYFKV